ncbi:hypothetical protein KAJ27_00730 [bacterium]|nr:hypothetical protein [bacterium]
MSNISDEKLFLESVEKNVLHSNFNFTFMKLKILEKSKFKKISSDKKCFRNYLIDKLNDLNISKNASKIDNCFIEVYDSGFLGSLAFALWFMKFDEDNWFSFQQVLTETEKFLADKTYDDRIELFLLKGLKSDCDNSAITVEEIPVTLNHSTGLICIWQGKLFD